MATKKRKLISAITAVAVSAAILLGGTYAWQSISQQALNEKIVEVNPGGRLHDDYDGTNKDVYVENFGDTPIFARVRLDEYMEIGAGAGLKTGAPDYDSKKATPVKVGTDINDMSTWVTHIPGKTAENDPFHKYVEWEMGGSTIYMPTFNKNKDSLKADINGTYEGTTPDDDTHYDDYHAYSVGEQKTEDAIYDNDDNAVDEGESAVNPDNITTQNETHTAKTTLNATVMTMQEWIDAGAKPGPYWVYDTDGWAYWAEAIEPDTSTGLLLNGLNQLSVPDDDWYYAINVVGQFASLGDWGTAEGNDGFFGDDAGAKPTDEAVFLLNQAAGYKLKVTVSAADSATTVKLGETLQMSAEVTIGGKKHANQNVTWSVVRKNSGDTNISESGLLTVGADEIVGGKLEVRAISLVDNTTIGTYEVQVESSWDTSGVGNITPGSTQTATIDGIEWYVLAKKGNERLLLSKDVLEQRAFDIDNNAWEGSDVQTYLNGDWLTGKAILNAHAIETVIHTHKKPDGDSWTDSNDKVFLLSQADVYGTTFGIANEPAKVNDYTLGKQGIVVPEGMKATNGQWWLRSPDQGLPGSGVVTEDGTVSSRTISRPCGIRPAMWIDLAQ